MQIPKIIVCDLDGTFVPKHTTITERGRFDLDLIEKEGVLFGIASGRPLDELKIQLDSWKIHYDFLIYLNGCGLYDCKTGKKEKLASLTADQIKKTFDFMDEFEYNPNMYENGETVVGKVDELILASQKYMGKKHVIYSDYSKFYAHDNEKIMFRISADIMEDVEAKIAKGLPEGIAGFKTGPRLIEFSPAGISKATALEKYCSYYNIDMKDVVAFGDTTNDNEMLQASGVGVCLRNGSQDTKEIADVITDLPCDEDGWSDYVEKEILIPNNLLKEEDIIVSQIQENEFIKHIEQLFKVV